MMLYTQRPCPACDGQRQQLHRFWDNYHAVRLSYTPTEYFFDLGYVPGEAHPPLLVPCRTCQGEGVTAVWAPAQELFPKFFAAFGPSA
ncbi:hypothetical protein [Hymenobacter sp. PAMC 26628]|uniref:hypothetical protein n=1 Tax=Hymenobacter sp. PAMC 26628 TaxID=1484118 RepID=UPI000770237D|nr:hypothetical protein [Hymenobacter sp. PAMC 26628]AMJ65018.1 hypothetical protein AXW84_05955 [Hymenobacter sp. PAMC 26628]